MLTSRLGRCFSNNRRPQEVLHSRVGPTVTRACKSTVSSRLHVPACFCRLSLSPMCAKADESSRELSLESDES